MHPHLAWGQYWLNNNRQASGSQSLFMPPTEQRLAQIEKEALAVTWACERFRDYLVGLTFHIQTDHKPLMPLFTSKSLDELPVWEQHFRLRLMHFNFTVFHVPVAVVADTLSRTPVSSGAADDEEFEQDMEAYLLCNNYWLLNID